MDEEEFKAALALLSLSVYHNDVRDVLVLWQGSRFIGRICVSDHGSIGFGCPFRISKEGSLGCCVKVGYDKLFERVVKELES